MSIEHGGRQPAITIAIPTRNRSGLLLEAIRSVQRQSFSDIEVLVGDNASTDDTQSVLSAVAAADSRVRVLRHPVDVGMVGNWNALVRAAAGRLFLLLSDDDVLLPHALHSLSGPFEDPGTALVYSRVLWIDDRERPIRLTRVGPERETGHQFVQSYLGYRREILPCATMYRLSARIDERPAYPEIGNLCDVALHLKYALGGQVIFLPRPVAHYRMHGGNLSLQLRAVGDSLLGLLRLCDSPESRLADYRADVRRHVKIGFRWIAAAAATRGDRAEARHALETLHALGAGSSLYAALVRLAGTAPLRAVARARRPLRAMRARALTTAWAKLARTNGPEG
jgi:hypothetical protein